MMSPTCYCGSQVAFHNCCEPLIRSIEPASSPERLMRSRYTAYCLGEFNYILHTYSEISRQPLDVKSLQESADGTRWVALRILSSATLLPHQVEFSAYYFVGRKPGVLHETSNFVLEHNQWRYHDGVLHDDCGPIHIGRNDPCFCASGKKFKQCCMGKALKAF